MLIGEHSLTIAVDFDGTIVEHKYPEIGDEMIFAFDTLKALQKNGHKLILWTFRSGQHLDEAVEFCNQNGVEFYAVNKSYPEEEYKEGLEDGTRYEYALDGSLSLEVRYKKGRVAKEIKHK